MNWYSNVEFPNLSFNFTNCLNVPDGNCIPRTITYTTQEGTKFDYTYGGWQDDAGFYTYSVVGNAAAYELVYNFKKNFFLSIDHTSYMYAANGRLISYADDQGATVSFTYLNAGRISLITDATRNRTVAFTFGTFGTFSRVNSIKDPAGGIWSYDYNPTTGMLTKVTSPGPTPTVRQYHYEGSDASLLTGVSINGIRYSTYSYYPDRRVRQSGLADGEEVDNFTYASNSTTVVDEKGQTTIYGISSVLGARLITAVSRLGTSTCPLSSAATQYDGNGFPLLRTDWNGVQTGYVYDAAGKLQSVTSARNTSSASTVAYTWVGADVASITSKDSAGIAYAKTDYVYFTSGLERGKLSSVSNTDLRTGAVLRSDINYTFHPNGILATKKISEVRNSGNLDTIYSYDVTGNLTSISNPLNQQETFSNYTLLGMPGRHTDINGVVT
ncbi:hypothetical protein LP420_38100 [Massilia sp. B-10]|nr:hypothetical protein LP420_38100 [Massilia sp. B-10]